MRKVVSGKIRVKKRKNPGNCNVLPRFLRKQRQLRKLAFHFKKIKSLKKQKLYESIVYGGLEKKVKFGGVKASMLLKTHVEKMPENCLAKMFMKINDLKHSCQDIYDNTGT
jgi:hypothetical protein